MMGAGARTLLAVEHPVRAAHQEGPHENELGNECADRYSTAKISPAGRDPEAAPITTTAASTTSTRLRAAKTRRHPL